MKPNRHIVLTGGAKTGKTTKAQKLSEELGMPVVCLDQFIRGDPEQLAPLLDNETPSIIEGALAPRMLKRWMAANPGAELPIQYVEVLETAHRPLTTRQGSIAIIVKSTMDQLNDEFIKRKTVIKK